MADDDNAAGIPAWQRKPQQQPLQPDNAASHPPPAHTTLDADTELREVPIPTPTTDATTDASPASDAQLREDVKTFLEDPAVKNASTEKKRAFFTTKGIPSHIIDELVKDDAPTFSTNDFASFKQQVVPTAQPTMPSRLQQRVAGGPPIIMYPEHLQEAHKPPPLITPARLLNTTYFVGGLAALIYGASKYLVTPMSDSLTEARHELAAHSQSKIDEMNEKLESLVSKVPAFTSQNRGEGVDGEEDAESVTSDPTELYHRDMGTQTSPPLTRSSSSSSDADGTKAPKKTPTEYQSAALGILQSHLQDMLSASERVEQANKTRKESADKLRHYLDEVSYGTMTSLNIWGQTAEANKKREAQSEDAVEELKKEIRGVKGVLLSAKRFPGVTGQQRVGA